MTREGLVRLGILLALAAAGLSVAVEMHGTPLPGDVELTRRIQRLGELDRNAGWINAAPSFLWIAAIGAALLAAFGRRVGWRPARPGAAREFLSALAVAVVLVLGDRLLKEIFRSPRPVSAFGVSIQGTFEGYGFPSGHVYSDVLMYGLLAVMAPAWLPRRAVFPVRAVMAGIIVLAGPARVVVGAHWPSDTLGGYLWGGAALCLALWFGRWVARR